MATRSTPPLAEAVQIFLSEREHVWSAATMRGNSSTLGLLVRSVGDKQIGRLTADDIARCLRDMRSGKLGTKPLTATSINSNRSRIKNFLEWAYRRGYCRGDLLDNFPKAKKEPRHDFLYLSAVELLQLLDTYDRLRDRALVAGAINTGLRASELTTIKLGDIDLDQSEFYCVIHKTGDSDRFPISADLDAEWRAWLAEYERLIGGPLKSDFYLFPQWRGVGFSKNRTQEDKGYDPYRPTRQTARIVHRGLRALGYSEERLEREGMHTLRRSVGRLYYDALRGEGHDFALRETAAFLHHAGTAMTEVYLGLSVERSKRNARLKGKPFITGMVQPGKLRQVASGE